ncbi:MAG: type II secretion system protein GspK [Acidobacteriia bacterium]|nr:type II secretion system protein GspK [Terriglobia bacterium]
MKKTRSQSDRGVILLIVLWVTIMLSVIAFGFASDIQLGARSVENTNQSAAGYFLAKAAVSEAVYEMMKMNQGGVDVAVSRAFKQQRIALQPITIQLETGTGDCWIENEAGKLDVNSGSPWVLQNLLVKQFGVEESKAESIAAAWTDRRKATPDSEGLLHGGPLTSVEEMLDVSGMKSSFVYGEWALDREGQAVLHRGLLSLATVYSASPRLNLNYASIDLLKSLPGVTDDQAHLIETTRAQRYFDSVDDCQQRTAVQFSDQARDLVSVEDLPVFTLLARGHAKDAGFDRTVRAIVQFGPTPMGYRILYWKDEEL